MATDTTVRARIDDRIKKQKALPFDVKVPNATTARTLRKADKGVGLTRSKNAADLFGKLGI
jgi:DNA-damage-inducible protein J